MTLLDERWKTVVPVPDRVLPGADYDPIGDEEEFLASEVDRLTEALGLLAQRHGRLIGTLQGAVLLGDLDLVVQALTDLGFVPPDGADPRSLMDNPPIAAVLEQVNR
jgi:hypothetical protein